MEDMHAMTPIETAARAMHASIQPAPDWAWDDPMFEPVREIYRWGIRAALEAMREPSQAMTRAGARMV